MRCTEAIWRSADGKRWLNLYSERNWGEVRGGYFFETDTPREGKFLGFMTEADIVAECRKVFERWHGRLVWGGFAGLWVSYCKACGELLDLQNLNATEDGRVWCKACGDPVEDES